MSSTNPERDELPSEVDGSSSTAPVSGNENDRLAALRASGLLDSEAESEYDNLAQMAADICATPISLISLVDVDRQWFKAKIGLDAEQTPRDISFCSHAICEPGEIMVVPDATQDERFQANPLVTDAPGIRFYAGIPLDDGRGHALGTLCVIDRKPRELKPEHQRALVALSRHFTTLLRLREANHRMAKEIEARKDAEQKLAARADAFRDLVENAADLVQSVAPDGSFLYVNSTWCETLGYSNQEALTMNAFDVIAPEFQEPCQKHLQAVMQGANLDALKVAFITKSGERVDLLGNVNCRIENGRPTATRGIFRIEHPSPAGAPSGLDAKDIGCICGWCKKMRNDEGSWLPLEEHLTVRYQIPLTHSICPACSRGMMDDLEDRKT